MALKQRYARYNDVPNCCENCLNYLKNGIEHKELPSEQIITYDECMCRDWSRVERANIGYALEQLKGGLAIIHLQMNCPHFQPNIICGDCKYAKNGKYHDERIGFCTFRCSCYKRSVIDIEPACKRYRVKEGDSK